MMSKKSPQLRFEGFTDDWEQRKFQWLIDQNIIDSPIDGNHGEKHPKSSDYVESGIPFLMAKDIKNNKVDIKNCTFISKETAGALDKGFAKNGDILLTHKATIGEVGILEGLNTEYAMLTPQITYYRILDLSRLDRNFFSSVLRSSVFQKNIHKIAKQSTRPYVGITEQRKLTMYFPIKIEEQQKIGSFFKHLDDTIALHQRKLDLLKEQKKGYLQKMFPKNGAKVPELRFAGFVDDWEERKLGDISYKVKEKNKTGEFTETLTNSAEYGIINQRDFFDKDISNAKNLTGYYVVKNDDFVYNPRISNFAPVGPIKRNKLGRTGVMSPLYYVFRTHDIDKNYFEKYFDTVYWHRFMELNGDSGARADRFAIKDSVFVEMPIPYPTMDEQQKIGSFFQQLDNTITLYQLKLDLLKEQKKGFLQKMFA